MNTSPSAWRGHGVNPVRALVLGIQLGAFFAFMICSAAAHLTSAHELAAILAMLAFIAFVGLAMST